MENKNPVHPPLRYPGSKYRAYKYIKPFIEKVHHDEYREPFLGSGAVFFQKNKVEFNWLNDNDKELINFYKVIQNEENCSQMMESVINIHPSKEWFEELKKQETVSEYDRAYKYFAINRTAYSGIMHMPNWGFHKTKSVQPDKWGNRLFEACRKLQGIKITDLDYTEIINAPSKGKSLLLFLDPPYYKADQKRAYKKSFEIKDHIQLAENLKICPYKFILTYDNCEEVIDLYSWANVFPVEFMYHTANSLVTTRKKGKELIITNYK